MRRPSFLFAMLFATALPQMVQAQVGDARHDFAIGVNGGALMNKVSFQPTIKQNWKFGETFGLTMRYTCEKYFSAICAITAEIDYANMGWKELIEMDNIDDTYSRDMRYVQIPILARLGWGRERKGFQFFVQAGPQLGYFISETEHFSDPWHGDQTWYRPNGVIQQYNKSVENKFEYGIAGGAGLEWSGKFGHLMLDARYFFALSDIYKNGKKDDFGRSANGPISVRVTYLIDLKKTKGDHIK